MSALNITFPLRKHKQAQYCIECCQSTFCSNHDLNYNKGLVTACSAVQTQPVLALLYNTDNVLEWLSMHYQPSCSIWNNKLDSQVQVKSWHVLLVWRQPVSRLTNRCSDRAVASAEYFKLPNKLGHQITSAKLAGPAECGIPSLMPRFKSDPVVLVGKGLEHPFSQLLHVLSISHRQTRPLENLCMISWDGQHRRCDAHFCAVFLVCCVHSKP